MISPNARYWIWITQAVGYGSNKINKLNELYKDIAQFYHGGEKEWRLCGFLSDHEISKLKSTPISIADDIINSCKRLGYSILCIDDVDYPECLINIYSSPAALYINGELPDIDNMLSIGIVGTRRASSYGTHNAYKFGYALGKSGVCVVSGGALGVDGASHRGTIAAGGVTVCVIGCGLNYDYPRENSDIRREIPKRGAVISEYPPDTPPMAYHFPSRNRIIAALSDGVLIIESGKKSGSLITANLAIEMGKELFALLGNNSPQNEGSNARIKEGTAIPVTDFMDILSAFTDVYTENAENYFDNINFADVGYLPVKGEKKAKKSAPSEIKTNNTEVQSEPSENIKPVHREDLDLSGDNKKVYEFLSAEPVHIDVIAQTLIIPVFRVSTALTQLQIMGVVKAVPGRKFALV